LIGPEDGDGRWEDAVSAARCSLAARNATKPAHEDALPRTVAAASRHEHHKLFETAVETEEANHSSIDGFEFFARLLQLYALILIT
jgi:hypothetical protein